MKPNITYFNQAYWDGIASHELRLSHCMDCHYLWLPPSPRCPNCLSGNIGTQKSSGRAKLWSWVVMHRQYVKEFPPPYIVAFIELEEGPCLMSTIVGTAAENLKCDMALEIAFESTPLETTTLKFRVA